MTTIVPTSRRDRGLTLFGLGAALSGAILGLFGALVALTVAVVLSARAERRAAALLVVVALLALALAYTFVTPVGTAPEPINGGSR